MKISGHGIHVGDFIEHKNTIWEVIKVEHVKPGKGGAYSQVEIRSIPEGIKLNERFRSAESVNRITLYYHDYKFLYSKENEFMFMNQETFDQVSVDYSIIRKISSFLKPGLTSRIAFYKGKIIDVLLPQTVIMTIIETEPTIRGQTIASSYKTAILENGIKVMVPSHIGVGELIYVDTNEKVYIERAKKLR